MLIQSAQIQLSSQRTFLQKEERSESLSVTRRGQEAPSEVDRQKQPDRSGLKAMAEELAGGKGSSSMRGLANLLDRVELSPMARGPQATVAGGGKTRKSHKDDDEEISGDSELQLFKALMEKLLKHKVDVKSFEPGEGGAPGADFEQAPRGARQRPSGSDTLIEYNRHESFYQAESTSFAAQGVVKTADGREISFQMGLDMSREYYHEENVSIRIGGEQPPAHKMKDPLVINFNGSAADLTDSRFAFDLNADGLDEQMSFLASNSGFLAFDKNGNGQIDNGSELFGPTTGDGFAELAAYDEDGNNFIDEGDSIYSKLQVYNKDSAGNDQVRSLKETGVGAIYLNRVDTQFSLNDDQNQQQGQVRETGIYLEEDGGVGTVQQIDLAV